MNTDSELLQRIAQKDRAAFKSLYEQTSPKLFALTLHIMRRESLAEEVLQEAYLKIWNHADSYDLTKGSVIGWMSVVTRNTALDALKALSRRPGSGAEVISYSVLKVNRLWNAEEVSRQLV